jgi:opacity protein-like surface antigen
MKRFVLAALAGVALMGAVSEADAQSRWRGRGGGTTVIEQPSSGIDANTLALLAATGALGAGGSGGMALLPFLLQGQTSQTTVIESPRRRWRPRPEPVPTSRMR